MAIQSVLKKYYMLSSTELSDEPKRFVFSAVFMYGVKTMEQKLILYILRKCMQLDEYYVIIMRVNIQL
jgi:hypothetical protein